MKIDIVTLFPNMFKGPLDESIIKRAQDKSLVEINIHDLRKWSLDERKTVDDRPYGGGVGMILKVDVVDKAVSNLKFQIPNSKQGPKYKIPNTKTILLDATGEKFTQRKAKELSKVEHLILIAGHYEGFDHRIHEHLVDEIISIGDYVLTGGELPAMVICDTIIRLIPNVLEKPAATEFESFSPLKINELEIKNCLEYPQYTRPENYNDWKVPEVLLSGNHKEIEKWRKNESIKKTQKIRPDLISNPEK